MSAREMPKELLAKMERDRKLIEQEQDRLRGQRRGLVHAVCDRRDRLPPRRRRGACDQGPGPQA